MPRRKKVEVGINRSRKSPMDPKIFLGNDYDPTKSYRWARQDKVDQWKAAGYEAKEGRNRYNEMVLMETSRDHAEERKKEKELSHREKMEALRRGQDTRGLIIEKDEH